MTIKGITSWGLSDVSKVYDNLPCCSKMIIKYVLQHHWRLFCQKYQTTKLWSNARCISYSTKRVNLTTPLFLKAQEHSEGVAVVDGDGTHTYEELLNRTNWLTGQILSHFNSKYDTDEAKISFLTPHDSSHVVAQWATWMSGSVALPLSDKHPASEWEYFLQDSQSRLVISTEQYASKLEPVTSKLQIPLHIVDNSNHWEVGESLSPDFMNHKQQMLKHNKYKNKPAVVVYTSGTTGRPKGVVHTFGSLQAQMDMMVRAWEWSPQDVVLHTLPLHHVHGSVNALMTPLYVGATCVMLPKFDAKQVWSALLTLSPVTPHLPRNINMFMGVPTMYVKLIEEHNKKYDSMNQELAETGREFVRAVCSSKIRLMISGSAPLPQPIMEEWHRITGHQLLERYGMTEFGMGLTNPLWGRRVAGAVGQPFPGVEVRIGKLNVYSDKGYDVIAEGNARRTIVQPGMENEVGELLVRGPNMFKEYLNRPEATADAFTSDGWFKTGDTARYEDGCYKILGRTSVDIIKSGGYKISALDVEKHLLGHEAISDVAVVALPDWTWGQKVAAVVALQSGRELTPEALKQWARHQMPTYHVPSVVKFVDSMPRNVMGKVNKKELLESVFTKRERTGS